MAILFPKFQGLVTGGAIGDGLFSFVPDLLYSMEEMMDLSTGINAESAEYILLSSCGLYSHQ